MKTLTPRHLARLLIMTAAIASQINSPLFAADQNPRQRLDFNARWSFHKGDPEGFGDQLSYPKTKPWLLPLANAFSKSPSPAATGELSTSAEYAQPGFDDKGWEQLDLPHDWAIQGPFKQEYPGETGKLPWWGVGWYRKHFEVPAADKGRRVYLDFDGAMAYATVWVNGRFAGGWPYGYSSFRVDVTPFLRFGEANVVAVRLDNPPESSRWYPGGGIYRNVWLVKTSPVHVGHWGTKIATPEVSSSKAIIQVETRVENETALPAGAKVQTQLYRVATKNGRETREPLASSQPEPATIEAGKCAVVSQTIPVDHPQLWNLDSPSLYLAVTRLTVEDRVVDQYETPFGIRKIEFTADRGLLLNGKRVPIQGVCNHHDLGALGAAFNLRAAQRQLEILKEMGVNALRTSHNPPAPELLDLCDRMGILVMDESFDCWIWGKTPNDYARLFNDWSERDLRAQIRRDRNHPCIMLWSVGNEIVKVEAPENAEIAKRLVQIAHEEDPTRPATSAVNNTPTGYNGFQKIFGVFGFNYRSMEYGRFHKANPAIPVYGSETSSTISSRGEYFFPVATSKDGGRADFQMSSYDLFAPPWAWPPDAEFKWLDETPAALGEFVWTGFDYLGEPTPYDDNWSNLLNISDPVEREKLKKDLEALGKLHAPSRSSYFGIVDLAGFKKDRFYLYQARWRPELPMAHILPHWTWPKRAGEITPVHVYTSGDDAELFLNGKSLGKKKKGPFEYRLRWDDVRYEPGELKVVVYRQGKHWAEDSVRTAGAPAKVHLAADRSTLSGDGKNLAFVTASILDKAGNLVPTANQTLRFEVAGPAEIVATDNGDATSHVSFPSKERPAFHGLALAIVRAKPSQSGAIRLKVTSLGLEASTVTIQSQEPSK